MGPIICTRRNYSIQVVTEKQQFPKIPNTLSSMMNITVHIPIQPSIFMNTTKSTKNFKNMKTTTNLSLTSSPTKLRLVQIGSIWLSQLKGKLICSVILYHKTQYLSKSFPQVSITNLVMMENIYLSLGLERHIFI